MQLHELKTYQYFFGAVLEGKKNFEVRKNDRDFKTGDILILREYSDQEGYSGRQIAKKISYILNESLYEGVKEGYVILGIKEPEFAHVQMTGRVYRGKPYTHTDNDPGNVEAVQCRRCGYMFPSTTIHIHEGNCKSETYTDVLRNRISSLMKENNKLLDKLTISDNYGVNVSKNIGELRGVIRDLKSERSEMESRITTLEKDNSVLEYDRNAVREKLESAEVECQQHKEELLRTVEIMKINFKEILRYTEIKQQKVKFFLQSIDELYPVEFQELMPKTRKKEKDEQ